jgi:uncharacterized protein (TIGR02118 family)
MIKVVATIRKLPEISTQDFRRYYEDNHAPLINRLLPYYQEYKRNYVDRGVFEGQPDPGFDVLTELVFASRDDYDAWVVALRNPAIVEQIREDERNFLLQGATRLWVVSEFADDVRPRPPADLRQSHGVHGRPRAS